MTAVDKHLGDTLAELGQFDMAALLDRRYARLMAYGAFRDAS